MKAFLLLVRKFWFVIPLALLLAALLLTRHRLADVKQDLAAERAAYAQFQADVKAKTELARISDAVHAARVERVQGKISQEVSDDYQKQLASLRARYDALRVQRETKANPSSSRGQTVPGLSSPTRRADDPPREDGLPAQDALIASEIALRLDALQDWVRGQQSIDRAN